VEKADSDLEAARRLVRSGAGFPTDVVCFHAQQCVEKYLKASLSLAGIDFPKTHDVRLLLSLLPPRSRPAVTPGEQRMLTAYATATRYPGWEEIPASQAREAVRLARRVRKDLRATLPKAALRRQRL
jgi:HEPN domain-containing protein